MAEEAESIRDRVVELLNQAAFLPSEKERISTLGRVQELVVHRETELLDTFYEEIVAFQTDRNSDVRKWVVGFIEEACKKDGRMLPLLLPNIQLLLEDSAVNVIKRCVQATAPLHRYTLMWIAQAHTVSSDMELAWIIFSGIKSKIVAMIDHDNDGVRTQVIKCLEAIILVQSYSEQSSIHRDSGGGNRETSFCLDQVPLTLKLARPRKLEEEAKQLLGKLVGFQGSIHISSVNLMTCMSSLVIIARARPMFLGTVVQALQLLHANLPPTLSKSQVNSVRKHLRLQLVNLLKHPSAGEFHDTIVAVLTDLGMSNSELNKAVPNRDEMRRLAKKRERARASAAKKEEKEAEGAARKRARLQSSTTSSSSTSSGGGSTTTKSSALPPSSTASSSGIQHSKSSSSGSSKDCVKESKSVPMTAASQLALTYSALRQVSAKKEVEESKEQEEEDEEDAMKGDAGLSLVDLTAKWVVQRLTIENVTELVMESMLALPPTMPGLFSAGYTPVAGAGSLRQRQQLARLLSAQLVAANVSPLGGAPEPTPSTDIVPDRVDDAMMERITGDSDDEGPLVSFLGVRNTQYTVPPPALPALILAPIRHKIAAVKLDEVTPVLSGVQQRSLQLTLTRRLLRSVSLSNLRQREVQAAELMVANTLTMASDDEVRAIENELLDDLPRYASLIELWLYTLYSAGNDFSKLSRFVPGAQDKLGLLKKARSTAYQGYDAVLLRVVRAALPQCGDSDTKEKFSRLLLACPSVTKEVVTALVEGGGGLQGNNITLIPVVAPLLRDLALWRSSVATHTATMLCCLAMHEVDEVRDAVLAEVEAILLSGGSLSETVVSCGQQQLHHLVLPQPPSELFTEHLGRLHEQKEWDERTVRACLHLPLAILPLHQALIHDLANVYVKTVNEAKRCILRLLEGPVGLMGMDSPQLLALVHSTPKGSETLITRIIHVLTEKAPPSEALVCQVRELYNRRVSDVRFLIPVLTGLSKKEVIAVLHKLIKLNPHVVKEVFNRLWGVTLDTGSSPLSPVELLVALHLIEPDKCDVKTVIKATGMCFQERSVYTAEVVGAALQQLLQEPQPPTLLMRTVIMALTHHPQLLAFIVTVLMTLIEKRVWEYPKIWEGFIKCCERASPQSMAVLLQLPLPQLQLTLAASADLTKALTAHLTAFTPHQRAHIPAELLAMVGLTVEEEEAPEDAVVPELEGDALPSRSTASPIESAA